MTCSGTYRAFDIAGKSRRIHAAKKREKRRLTYVAMIGVFRKVTCCISFSSSDTDSTLMLERQVIA